MSRDVFIDANLLFYKIISDLLFDASKLGLIKVHWSERVIGEYIEHGPNILNDMRRKSGLPEDLGKAKIMVQKKIALFRKYSGFILVKDYDKVEIPNIGHWLSDKDDIHILKATMKSKCSVLLTLDKDFKKISSLPDVKIIVKKADDFFCELFDHNRSQMLDVIEETRQGLERQRNNPFSQLELAKMMNDGKLIGLAQKLR